MLLSIRMENGSELKGFRGWKNSKLDGFDIIEVSRLKNLIVHYDLIHY